MERCARRRGLHYVMRSLAVRWSPWPSASRSARGRLIYTPSRIRILTPSCMRMRRMRMGTPPRILPRRALPSTPPWTQPTWTTDGESRIGPSHPPLRPHDDARPCCRRWASLPHRSALGQGCPPRDRRRAMRPCRHGHSPLARQSRGLPREGTGYRGLLPRKGQLSARGLARGQPRRRPAGVACSVLAWCSRPSSPSRQTRGRPLGLRGHRLGRGRPPGTGHRGRGTRYRVQAHRLGRGR